MILLALDPGGSTGWSLWAYDAISPLQHIEHGTIKDGLRGFLRWWDSRAHRYADGSGIDEIVIEDFVLDGRTERPDTTPLEILGAVEFIAYFDEIPIIRQRNFAKGGATDECLKRNGIWWEGEGHDRDSARHALVSLKSRKHRPTQLRYWPPRGGS